MSAPSVMWFRVGCNWCYRRQPVSRGRWPASSLREGQLSKGSVQGCHNIFIAVEYQVYRDGWKFEINGIAQPQAHKMEKQVRYGNKLAVVRSAEGVEGVLIRTLSGKYAFRVEHGDGEFTDYELRHTDLWVTICDPLAALYTIGDRQVLDHDPGTLGLEEADESQS